MVLFHPRVSAPPPMPSDGPCTLDAMIAEHKARQARFAAAGARETARLRASGDDARWVRELNEKAAAEAEREIRKEEKRLAKERLANTMRIESAHELSSICAYPSIRRIIVTVAKAYEVSPIDIVSARRTHDVVPPRHVAMYLAKTTTLRSLPDIGRRFGKDHTTVHYAVRKTAACMAVDDAFKAKVEALRAALTEAQAA